MEPRRHQRRPPTWNRQLDAWEQEEDPNSQDDPWRNWNGIQDWVSRHQEPSSSRGRNRDYPATRGGSTKKSKAWWERSTSGTPRRAVGKRKPYEEYVAGKSSKSAGQKRRLENPYGSVWEAPPAAAAEDPESPAGFQAIRDLKDQRDLIV